MRRNTQRLCKLAVCLATLAVVCYLFGKCNDFVPILSKKLDGFSDEFNKLLPQLNTMLKSNLNDTADVQAWNKNDLESDSGSYLKRKDEMRAQISNERDTYVKVSKPTKVQNKQLKDLGNDFSISQSDFIKVFAKFTERQNFEADRRQSQFEKLLKNLTRILVEVHQKRQEDIFVVEGNKNDRKQSELLPVKNPIHTGENESLKRRISTSQAFTGQRETTVKEELNMRNGKESITGTMDSTVRKNSKVKTQVLSKEDKKPSISVNKFTEILPTEELSIRNENEITNTIKSTTREHLILKTPALSKRNQKPNVSVNKFAGVLPKDVNVHNGIPPATTRNPGNLFEPNTTSSLKVNFPTRKTDNLVQLKEKSITFRTSYKVLTTKANMAGTKTQVTETMRNIASFKQPKRSMDQNTLNRRAEIFLRKMKNFGITYNESIFYYKGQLNSGIFYREVSPVLRAGRNKLTIFLLHDSHHDSKTWLSVGTLYALAIHGYKVVALDLPGHGKSINVPEPATSIEKLKLLVSFMLAVTPKGPRVLVSPGESGLYSVPMVMSASVMLKGVVFVSTAYTGKYPASKYENVHLPALVIHGENDASAFLGEFLESMNHLNYSERIHSIKNAGRDCYVEQPDVFHELLTEFLLKLSRKDKTRKHARAQKS